MVTTFAGNAEHRVTEHAIHTSFPNVTINRRMIRSHTLRLKLRSDSVVLSALTANRNSNEFPQRELDYQKSWTFNTTNS
jgi:hypothetical protein